MDTLQTQQTELEKGRAASLRGWEAKTLCSRICLTASESADKQASEMMKPLLRGGSGSNGEEGEEEFTERESRVGNEPVSSAQFSDHDVANIASQASAELKAMRRQTLGQVSE